MEEYEQFPSEGYQGHHNSPGAGKREDEGPFLREFCRRGDWRALTGSSLILTVAILQCLPFFGYFPSNALYLLFASHLLVHHRLPYSWLARRMEPFSNCYKIRFLV